MENTNKSISKEEALKKVAEVLEEALAEYETLEKMDLELAEDPSRPFAAAPKQGEEQMEDEEEKDEDEEDKDEDEEEKDEDEMDKDKDKEMSDEAMKSEYAALHAKMAKRGLIKSEPVKTETPKTEMKKSETAPAEDKVESLKKSFDGEIAELKKAVASIAEVVNKIAAQPVATRKGVSGYAPLKKSEESSDQPLQKAQVLEKLLDLKKSGDRRINTSLINRIETNRANGSDLEFIKGILG